MWFLYILNKQNSFQGEIFRRLVPNREYHFNGDEKNSRVIIRISKMPIEKVKVPNFRPTVSLFIEGNQLVTIDGQEIGPETELIDQQRIKIGKRDSQLRIQWENCNIHHTKTANVKDHEMLIEMATKYGFHVVPHFEKDLTTHMFLSDSEDPDLEPSKDTLLALCHETLFVSESWIKQMEVEDVSYSLSLHNKHAKSILIENWGPLGKQAVFGPSKLRKTLFNTTEFWFFDNGTFHDNKHLVELCGGTSKLCTLAEGMNDPISEIAVFVMPRSPTDEWNSVKQRYCETMEVSRCIVETEITLSIVHLSTNLCCNPAANLTPYVHASNPLSASLSSEFEQSSVKVKEEPMDDTVPGNYGHTLSLHPTFEPEDDPYDSEDENMMNDNSDTVPPTVAANENHYAPRIKEEEVEATVNDFVGAAPTLPEADDAHETQENNTEHHDQEMQHDSHEMNQTQANDQDHDMTDIQDPEPEPSLALPDDSWNFGDMFGDMMATQKKNVEKQRAEKKEQEEQAKRENEQQEKERLERLRLAEEQREKERQDRQRQQRERQNREREERERQAAESRLEEEEEERAETPLPPLNEDQAAADYDDQGDDSAMDVESVQPSLDDHHRTEDTQEEGRYSKVVFAPLVIKPRPSSTPAPIARSSGVNFKKFVKTRQFQTVNRTDIVTLLTSSQMPSTQEIPINNRRREVRIENAADFDPDIMITTARRRVR